ncbi:MAG: guanylate kinase [Chloroflexi bacterium]|nr:MAG: guanylate kinase [Chloroflexota bacterium]
MPVKERLATLFILVGPGGVGKNALMTEILKRSDKLKQLATATTRAPRTGERDGIHHLFVTVSEFRQMIEDDELLEYQEVHPGKFYGVPRRVIKEAIQNRQDLIADIEFKGAEILQQQFPDNSITIFIAPPSVDALQQRMVDRQDSIQDIQDRLNRMSIEMLYAPRCDYIIVNDHFDTALAELNDIIQLERGEIAALTTPLHQVSYIAHITFKQGDKILKITEQPYLPCPIKQGDTPYDAVTRCIANYLKQPVNNDQLRYAHPAGLLPVEMMLHQRQYQITYHFLYELPSTFEPLNGLEWSS